MRQAAGDTRKADAGRVVALLAQAASFRGAAARGFHFRPEEWDRLIDLAVEQGLAPWLAAQLQSAGVPLPSATAERLADLRVASTALNMRVFDTLEAVLEAFRAAGIPAVTLKGAWLAKAVYHDEGIRPMGDIDLWVPRVHLGAARGVMAQLGYAVQAQASRPQALQDALTGETQMWRTDSPVVELHWNIFPGEWVRHTATVDEQAVWNRAVPGNGLSAEDAVIHLCVHLAVNHQMSLKALRTLVDLDGVRRTWAIDWRVVLQRAQTWRVAGAVWLVLRLLADLFGDPRGELPLTDLAPPAWRRAVLARMASPAAVARGLELRTGPRRFLLLLALVDRPACAARLVWRTLLPDRAWLTLRYGAPGASAWTTGRLRAKHLLHVASRREV